MEKTNFLGMKVVHVPTTAPNTLIEQQQKEIAGLREQLNEIATTILYYFPKYLSFDPTNLPAMLEKMMLEDANTAYDALRALTEVENHLKVARQQIFSLT